MINIEWFQRESGSKNHTIRVWIKGNLVYANEMASPKELESWRDAFEREYLWMDECMELKDE